MLIAGAFISVNVKSGIRWIPVEKKACWQLLITLLIVIIIVKRIKLSESKQEKK